MKKAKTAAITLALLLVLTLTVTLTTQDAFALYRTSVGDAATPEKYREGYVQHNCLDISSWNGDLTDENWEAIKASGVDSVIIRAGYSKLNTNRLKKDERFEQNLERAKKHGLSVGVYYFTTALTQREMIREANFFMKIIKPYRDQIDLPVALDFETNSGGRLNWRTLRELGKDNCTDLCITFCDIIADSGYEPMLYASRGLFNTYLDAEKLENKYAIWLAQYTSDLSATGYTGEYYMWQYSANVRIPGVKCRFDGNYRYEKEYTSTNAPKEIKSSEGDTVTYELSDGVRSVLPVKSKGKTAKAQVTDSYGNVHDYKIYRSEDYKYTDDECIMVSLLSGFDIKYKGSKGSDSAFGDLDAYSEALDEAGVINYRYPKSDDAYLDIKSNLANGMPVVISIDSDSGPWKGESQRLLLIGMDEDGRAIVADTQDRKWFETDQRLKLTDVDELIEYIDDGYIIIEGAQ